MTDPAAGIASVPQKERNFLSLAPLWTVQVTLQRTRGRDAACAGGGWGRGCQWPMRPAAFPQSLFPPAGVL